MAGNRAASGRISAPRAEELGIFLDWPTWPLGAALPGDWQWLLEQVKAGNLPDLPCRWSEAVTPGRHPIYWLDPQARTRHVVVGYGQFVLTCPSKKRVPRTARHALH